jgi:hypothetical protein
LCKLLGVGRRKQVFINAQHLRQLQRTSLELAEGFINRACIHIIQIFPQTRCRRLWTDRTLAVKLEVIQPNPGTGPRQLGHAAQRRAADAILRGMFGGHGSGAAQNTWQQKA